MNSSIQSLSLLGCGAGLSPSFIPRSSFNLFSSLISYSFSQLVFAQSRHFHISLTNSRLSCFLSSAVQVSNLYYFQNEITSHVYVENSTLDIRYCTFNNCSSTNGGALCVMYMSSSNVSIVSSVFQSCSATGNGGALFLNSSTVSIKRSCFLYCTLTSNGWGAVSYIICNPATLYMLNAADCPLSSSSISGTVFHTYTTEANETSINISNSCAIYDLGTSLPLSNGNVNVNYVLTSNGNGGCGIGLALFGSQNSINCISFVNNTIKYGLIWMRNGNNFTINHCVLIGSIPRFYYYEAVTVTFVDFYSNSSTPSDLSYVANPSSLNWNFAGLTTIAFAGVGFRGCNETIMFSNPANSCKGFGFIGIPIIFLALAEFN